MSVISFTKPRNRHGAPHTDQQTGEACYPYAPDEYEEIHIVGHKFENGQYLPVKVFVGSNMGDSARQKALTDIWQHKFYQRSLMAFGMGILCGMIGLVVVMIMLAP